MAQVDVVVPVYNVENFLPACVDSILQQTFSDFSLLLVDDGSTDKSGSLCDQYAKKDSRISVVHKENKGLSHTRNVGIDHANAQYLLFVDSDDFLEPDTLEQTVSAAQESGADLILFGYYVDVVKDGKLEDRTCNLPEKAFLSDPVGIAERMVSLKRNFLFDPAWNKLYRTEILKNSQVRMPEGEIFEDTAFNLSLLPFLSSVDFLNKCFYHYMQRDAKRITNSYHPEKPVFLKKRHLSLMKYLERFPQIRRETVATANFIYIKYVFSGWIDLFLPECHLTAEKRLQLIRKDLEEPVFQKALADADGSSKMENLVLKIAKSKKPKRIASFAKILYRMKYQNKKLFFFLKRKNMGA